MGDEDEGDAERFLQGLQLLLHLLAQLEIECAERFVEEKHARPVDERARQRHALALAAGKLAGAARAVAGKLDHGERVLRRLQPLCLADTLDHQAIGDILEDREMREEGIVLEHRVDVAPVGRHALRRLAENLDMPRRRLLEAGHQAQAGGLAGAGRPEHREEFTLGDGEIHAVDGAHGAEMAGHLLEQNGGHGGSRWF